MVPDLVQLFLHLRDANRACPLWDKTRNRDFKNNGISGIVVVGIKVMKRMEKSSGVLESILIALNGSDDSGGDSLQICLAKVLVAW